jgi:trigger factor
VPRKVFEQAYGAGAITHEAVEDVVPQAYARAVREHDLDPTERPKIEILEETEGRPTRVKATVEVRPEIELRKYKGVPISRPPAAVGDDDVERAIGALAKERATLVPVDRPAEAGDVVTLDYAGSIDGQPFEGGTASGETAELNEGRFIPGFVGGIVGMRASETKEIHANFPPGYPQPDLAGKEAVFAVTVHDVKRYELPPLDDAFAAAISELGTIDQLRADVRRRLEALAAQRERRAVANAVLDVLVREHDFSLPPSMVDAEVDHLVNDAAANAAQSGEAFERYLERAGKTEEELRAAVRPDAEMRVKTTLLVEQIAKQEGIVATPADVAAEIEVLARQYGQSPDRVRKALGSNVLPLMAAIVRNKTLDFLVQHAEVTPSP